MNKNLLSAVLVVVVIIGGYLALTRQGQTPVSESFSTVGYRVDNADSKRAIVLRATDGGAPVTLPESLSTQLHFFTSGQNTGERLNSGLFPIDPTDPKKIVLLTSDNKCPERASEAAAACTSLNSIYSYDTASEKLTLLATTTLSSAEGSELNVQATQGTKLILTVHQTGTGGICDNPWIAREYLSLDLAHPEQGIVSYELPAAQKALGQAELEKCRQELQ